MASQRPSEIPVHRLIASDVEESLRRGEAVAVDVRSPEAYAAGHLPGSLSIPIARLRAEIDRLPRDRSIVFY